MTGEGVHKAVDDKVAAVLMDTIASHRQCNTNLLYRTIGFFRVVCSFKAASWIRSWLFDPYSTGHSASLIFIETLVWYKPAA
ncbi:hypothetical protein OH492_06920 [Vibrio chagasii]|nr:hypothetical protein [Vibrio chagasii]